MKAAEFAYHRAVSVEDAIRCLTDYEEGEARVIAGGQSLMPMLNMRLWRLAALVDINGVTGLNGVHVDEHEGGKQLRLGAMLRHVEVGASPIIARHLPLMTDMIRRVGDHQVRNRGTLGGSLAQADPTGEMPLACLALGARIRAEGPDGARDIPIEDFYLGPYATALHAVEIITEVIFPASPQHHVFLDFSRRHSDFCVLSVAACGDATPEGRWRNVRLSLGGAGDTPMLATHAMGLLEGSSLSDQDIDAAARAVAQYIDPVDDIRASAEYRAHLIPIYTRRALLALRAKAA